MIGGFEQYHLLSKKIGNFSGKLELICWRITLYPIFPYLKRVLLSIKKFRDALSFVPPLTPSPQRLPAPPSVRTGTGRQREREWVRGDI
jgi:hypothetical protein